MGEPQSGREPIISEWGNPVQGDLDDPPEVGGKRGN
jgi:hypothetical protein